PAPVAADRQEGQPLVRRRMDLFGREPPQGSQQGVGGLGIEARGLGTVGSAFGSACGAGAIGVEAFTQERGDGGARVRRRGDLKNDGRERRLRGHDGEHSMAFSSRSSRRLQPFASPFSRYSASSASRGVRSSGSMAATASSSIDFIGGGGGSAAAANSGRSSRRAVAAFSFSSRSSTSRARPTTAVGTPARRATCTP